MGAATELASVCESAPGYVADTVTWTGVIDGYWATGSWLIDTRPAIAMISATTAAKIGRSMKKRENIRPALLLHRDVDAARLVVVVAAGDFDRRQELDALAIDAELHQLIPHRLRALLGELD